MLTLCHAPGACSEGIVYLLNEIGAEFAIRRIALYAGDQNTADYGAINPKRKVPALILPDGSTVTEFPVIAQYIARTHPDAGLWPDDLMQQVRIMEAMDYITATVHMRAFTFVIAPQRFVADEAGQAALRAYGEAEVAKGFALLSEMLGDKEYLFGDFSVADAALFFVLNWADGRCKLPMPANLDACFRRMQARPAWEKTLPELKR